MEKNKNAGDFLREAAELYAERNKVYGDNYKLVGPVINALFPEGVILMTVEDYNRWHLLELLIVKLTRYCNNWKSGGHQDSIIDLGVYAFMCCEVDEAISETNDLTIRDAEGKIVASGNLIPSEDLV